MKQFKVTKFECKTLKQIGPSDIVVAVNADEARNIGEKRLHCQPNQFVGAEALPS